MFPAAAMREERRRTSVYRLRVRVLEEKLICQAIELHCRSLGIQVPDPIAADLMATCTVDAAGIVHGVEQLPL